MSDHADHFSDPLSGFNVQPRKPPRISTSDACSMPFAMEDEGSCAVLSDAASYQTRVFDVVDCRLYLEVAVVASLAECHVFGGIQGDIFNITECAAPRDLELVRVQLEVCKAHHEHHMFTAKP